MLKSKIPLFLTGFRFRINHTSSSSDLHATVVFEGNGYGNEMAIGYEGVEVDVGDFFEHIFAF